MPGSSPSLAFPIGHFTNSILARRCILHGVHPAPRALYASPIVIRLKTQYDRQEYSIEAGWESEKGPTILFSVLVLDFTSDTAASVIRFHLDPAVPG